MSTPSLSIIDVATSAGSDPAARRSVTVRIDRVCREQDSFYVVRHGIEVQLVERLEHLARQFLVLDEASKLRWRVEPGGRAWRGYFPLGGELTPNRPDWKEGLYLSSELDAEHPEVRAGTPLHGANLFPEMSDLRETLLEHLDATTRVGHRSMEGIAPGLGLGADYFAACYTGDLLIFFRLFNYPSQLVPGGLDTQWGVGEHTDYGLFTLPHQDATGDLQVRTPQGWLEAPPIPDSFVCNLGDMFERMTGGLYRSTPHRVARNISGRDRLSFPLFFGLNFHVRVQPTGGLPGMPKQDDSARRWDQVNAHAFHGEYGDYLLNKVVKVFSQLRHDLLQARGRILRSGRAGRSSQTAPATAPADRNARCPALPAPGCRPAGRCRRPRRSTGDPSGWWLTHGHRR